MTLYKGKSVISEMRTRHTSTSAMKWWGHSHRTIHVQRFIQSCIHTTFTVQWNLVIMRTLGPWKLPFISGLLLYQGLKKKKKWVWRAGTSNITLLFIRGFCYIRPLYNEVPLYSALIWQKEASDKSDISRKRAKCVCHLYWRQWNIRMSYLTYLLVGWVFLHEIWPGRRAHYVNYENINNSNLDGMSLASFCQSRAVLFYTYNNHSYIGIQHWGQACTLCTASIKIEYCTDLLHHLDEWQRRGALVPILLVLKIAPFC